MMKNEDRDGDFVELGEVGVDFSDTINVFRRRRFPLLVSLVLVSTIFIVIQSQQPKVYRAETLLNIDLQPARILANIQEVYALGTRSYWMKQEYYNTQARIIRSVPVLGKTVNALGLSPVKLMLGLNECREDLGPTWFSSCPEGVQERFVFAGVSRADSIEVARSLVDEKNLSAKIKSILFIDVVDESSLLMLRIENTSPQWCARIANAVAEAYSDYNLEQKSKATEKAVDWLSEKVSESRRKLRASEKSLHEFRLKNGLLDVSDEDQSRITVERLSHLNRTLSDVSAKRMQLQSRLRSDLTQVEGYGDLQDSLAARQSNLIGIMQVRNAELRAEESELLGRYTQRHPEVNAIHRKIDVLEKRLAEENDRFLSTLKLRVKSAIENERLLLIEIKSIKESAFVRYQKQGEYEDLLRSRDNNRMLFDMIRKRHKEVNLTKYVKANNIGILERAVIPTIAVKPNLRLIVLIGLLLGIGAGIGVALSFEYFDNTVKDENHVATLLELPVLGVIPAIQADDRTQVSVADRDHFGFNNPRSQVAESIRTIRTNLMFMSPGHSPRRILVTSSQAQEGKSMTAINIAATMAMSGNKVVLLDTDLRRPRLHKSFGLNVTEGLTNVIMGVLPTHSVIVPNVLEGVDLCPCGTIPPNPSELLHLPRFAEILDELSQRYDLVILDSPPVCAVSDAMILSGLTDGCVFVVRAGVTTQKSSQKAVQRLRGVKTKMLGVIVNAMSLSSSSNSYYQYYGTDDEEQSPSWPVVNS
jgi:polysaccharide biosynthesis transport protein